MTHIPLDDILRLPLEERLDLVERIWDSIAADQAALPLSEEHRRELDRRLDEPESGPSITWEELQKRLREQG
jgi:putative addiction module component (TIGR02574 family)